MSRFLLVGGGIGQLHLARKIKERGDILTVMAYHTLPEIETIADQVIKQDLFDLQGSLKAASEVGADAVVSDQHDLYIPTVAFISENLGLPGNTYEQVLSFCDKNQFRDLCERVGVPVPKHRKVKGCSFQKAWGLEFPLMIKPTDAQSSLGITKVYRANDYSDAVEKAIAFSRSHTAIVEEFFHGREIVSEGFIADGEYYSLAFGDRRYFNIVDTFIPSQTLFPADIPEHVKAQIIHYESLIASQVQPRFAIVHSEWLWNSETDSIVCVESALRGGGVFISSHIIPLATGLDINDLLLRFAIGEQIDMDSFLSNRVERSSGYICFYLPEGKILSVHGRNDLYGLRGVALANLDSIHVGDKTEAMTHKGQRLGPIVLHSDTRLGLESIIEECQSILRISVLDINGHIQGAKWV